MRLSYSLLAISFAVLHIEAYKQLSDAAISAIPIGNFDIHDEASLLRPLLRPRVPGTPDIEQVRHYFTSYFDNHLPKWQRTFHNATLPTALRRDIAFSNLVFARDPPWARAGEVSRLTLVAHYDSKIQPRGFIGATDSAAPCAMLLHVAAAIDAALTAKWDAMTAQGVTEPGNEKGVQIFLLDGEEAFVEWSAHDSTYGARALADELDTRMNPGLSTFRNGLNEIALFVLLDLLGTKDPAPRVPSYFQTTHWAYQKMALVEKKLRDLKLFRSKDHYQRSFFPEFDKVEWPWWQSGGIEDDHIPFMQKGVEILHIIPSPFPRVWHTPQDDGEHLDIPTVEDWANIAAGFTAEWMELDEYMPKSANKRPNKKERQEKRNELLS